MRIVCIPEVTRVLGAVTLIWATASAQAQADTAALITVTSVGEATFVPDRSTIVFAVETRANSAAEASRENARKHSAVIQALRGQGIGEREIATTDYMIWPFEEATRSGETHVRGYGSRNSLVLEVSDPARVGTLIDIALAAGANRVNSLRMYSSREEELRRDALRDAIARGRRDAEAIAEAAGSSLGAIRSIEVVGGARIRREGIVVTASAMRADTPILPGESALRVTVIARYRLAR